MFIQNHDRIIVRKNVMPRQMLNSTTNCIPINLAFQENFPTNFKFGTACAIEMTTD